MFWILKQQDVTPSDLGLRQSASHLVVRGSTSLQQRRTLQDGRLLFRSWYLIIVGLDSAPVQYEDKQPCERTASVAFIILRAS
jgi:hypothetical protein